MMSPVMMKDCGPCHAPSSPKARKLPKRKKPVSLEPGVWNLTVVSVVEGNVFSKSRARSGSVMRDVTSWMTFSIASELKVRHRRSGRWKGSCSLPSDSGALVLPQSQRTT